MSKEAFAPVCARIKLDFDMLVEDIYIDPFRKIIIGAYEMPHTKKGILCRLSKMHEYVDKWLQKHEDEDPCEEFNEYEGEEAYNALRFMRANADWESDPYDYIRIRILAELFEGIVECYSLTFICSVCKELMARVQALPDGAQL